jgi:hypothetical protein
MKYTFCYVLHDLHEKMFLWQVGIFNEVKGKAVSLSKISYELLICSASVDLQLQCMNTNAETVFITRPTRLVHLWPNTDKDHGQKGGVRPRAPERAGIIIMRSTFLLAKLVGN